MKIFITTVFVFLTLMSFSQRVIKKITNEMCDCFSAVDIEKTSVEEAKNEFEKCFIYIVYYAKDLRRLGYDILSEEDADDVTRKIVDRLMFRCPDFMNLVTYYYLSPSDTIKANISDSIDCRILRNGKFRMLYDAKEYIIENKGKIQIETDINGNIITKSKITWVNDCEYIIKTKSTSNEDLKKLSDYNSEARVTILEIENKVVKFRMQLGSLFYFGEMVLME